MKKSILMKLLVLAVCAAMLLSLFACGPEVETEPTEEPTQQETEKPTDGADDKTTEAPTQAGGQDTDPTETDPVETDPTETDPVETDPTETDPEESKPAETDPEESKPAETDPEVETNPVETDPACDGNHNYVAKGPQGHYCDKCGNPGRDNPILEHTYEDKDGVPTCSVCGYIADCKGEHTAYIGDETGHWTAPCDQCGAAAGTKVSDHTYEYANDKYACTVCGWTLTCDGKHELVIDDEKTHHTAACEICNVPAGEPVAHVFANSVCECGYEAACKGTHKIEADAEGHSIGACDICGAAEQVKQPHVWGTEYYTAGESYVYGCKECGYAKYTKVLTAAVKAFFAPVVIAEDKQTTYYNIGHASNTEGEVPFASFTGKGGTAQVLWMRAYEDTIYSNNAAASEQEKLDIGKATYLVIKLRKNSADQQLVLQFSTTGKNSTTAVAEEAITNKAGDKVLVEAGATYNTNNGYSSFTLPMALAEVNEWTTFVIDLAKVVPSQMVLDSETNTYVVDTLYYNIDGFEAEMTLDVAYMAFVEGGWTEIGENVDEETAVSVAQNNVGSVVDPATGGCVGEHVFATTLVDGEYKSACSCGYVKSSYGIKEEGPNKFGGAETLATSGSVTGKVDKTLMFDEDGTAFVRLDNYWPNRDNWGDIGINLDRFAGTGATGRYLVIKVRVGAEGNGTNAIEVYVNTNQSGSKNLVGEGGTSFSISKDNKWHTVVIDLAERVSKPDVAFLPDEDGSYNVRYFSIRAFASTTTVTSDEAEGRYFYSYWVTGEDGKNVYKEQVLGKENRLTAEQMTEKGYTVEKIHKCAVSADAYVDLSYVALFDSLDDIKNVVTADTYEWSIDRTSSALKNTADGSCAAHTYREVVDGTTHKIQCTTCEHVLREYSISADINYYADLGSMNYYSNAGTGLDKLLIDPVAGVLYNHYYATSYTHWNFTGGGGAGSATSATYNSGEYIVMKVRAAGAEKTSMTLRLSTNGKDVNAKTDPATTIGTFTVNAKDGWVVLVVKIGTLSTYTTKTDANLYFMGAPADDKLLDVAYLAVVDSIEEMKTLLGENETYRYYEESFSNIPVEYDQAGNKVPCKPGECEVDPDEVSITEDENGDKIYSYLCAKCQVAIYTRVVPAGVTFIGSNNIKNKESGTIANPDAAKEEQYATKNTLNVTDLFQATNVKYAYDAQPYVTFNGTKAENKAVQMLWVRSVVDNTVTNTNGTSTIHANPSERYTIDVGQAKYAMIKMRSLIAGAEESNGTLGLTISSTGKKGNKTIQLPIGEFQNFEEGTSEWVTFVIDLTQVAADNWKVDETTDTYVLDTFYLGFAPFVDTDRVDFEYIAFVDDWADVQTLAGEDETVVRLTNAASAYEMVDFDAAIGTEANPEIIDTLDDDVYEIAVEEGDKDGYTYSFVAPDKGTVTLYFWDMEEDVEGEIIVTNKTTGEVKTLSEHGVDNYGMELVVDVNAGDVLLIQVVSIDSEDAEANPAATLIWTGFFAYPVGTEKNPAPLDYDTMVPDEDGITFTFTITAPVGTTYYSGFGGMYIAINGEDKGILPMDGTFVITNEGETEAEYEVKLTTPIGWENNPDTLVEGDNSVDIPEAVMRGYYYAYTAPKSGMLTITVSSTTGWFYEISRTYFGEEEQWVLNEETGEMELVTLPGYVTDSLYYATSDMEGAWNPITVQVEEGDVITVWVNTFDPDPEALWNPAGTVTVNARFVEDHECVSDAEFACKDGKCTICGEEVPAEDHAEPDATTGKCIVCGEKIAEGVVSETKATTSATMVDKTLTGDGFTMVASENATIDDVKCQMKANDTITVSANQISKIVISGTRISGATATEGVEVVTEGEIITLTVTSGTLDEIVITMTDKTRMTEITVYYVG